MDNYTIQAEKREKGAKNDQGGLIPAVVYGKGQKSQSLWVDKKHFDKIYQSAGESSIIDLVISNGQQQKPEKVLIYDIQQDPVTDQAIHIDFYIVRMDEVIETDVELRFVGESPAVKEQGGILVKNIDEVEVKCFPADLPKEIVVDISKLKTFEDYIYIKDLEVSEKVTVNIDPETVVALVSPPRSQEEIDELETEVEADITQIEGIEKPEGDDENAETEKKGEEKNQE